MAVFAWIMMGLAVWHFTVFLPDREWGGIIGAFLGALVGSFLFGFIISGFAIPAEEDTHILTALEGIPGAVIGIGVMYLIGIRIERNETDPVAAES